MNKTADILSDLPLFPTHVVPDGRRTEMERLLEERRASVGRAVSNGAVLALCACFAVFYGVVSTYAWANGGHPAFGVLFSIFCCGLLVCSVSLAAEFGGHLRAVVAVPDRLRREAEAEATLAQAALDLNIKAIFWNGAAREARAHDVSPTIVEGLIRQRAAFERRRAEIAGNLRRFRAATAPKPRAVRPPADWGPVEKIDLSAHTDL